MTEFIGCCSNGTRWCMGDKLVCRSCIIWKVRKLPKNDKDELVEYLVTRMRNLEQAVLRLLSENPKLEECLVNKIIKRDMLQYRLTRK